MEFECGLQFYNKESSKYHSHSHSTFMMVGSFHDLSLKVIDYVIDFLSLKVKGKIIYFFRNLVYNIEMITILFGTLY
jgi:hypothetical protein